MDTPQSFLDAYIADNGPVRAEFQRDFFNGWDVGGDDFRDGCGPWHTKVQEPEMNTSAAWLQFGYIQGYSVAMSDELIGEL